MSLDLSVFSSGAKKAEAVVVDAVKKVEPIVAAAAKETKPVFTFVEKEVGSITPKLWTTGKAVIGEAEKMAPSVVKVATVGGGIFGGIFSFAGKLFGGFTISWKWITVGIILLVIGGSMFAGYTYIHGLTEQVATAEAAKAQAEVLKNAAEARANDIQKQHDAQIDRINTLEAQRTQIASEVMSLRQQLNDTNVEKDVEGNDAKKADAAVAALNARNAQLNRLLSQASGGKVRPDPGRGSKTRKTWSFGNL